MPVKNKKCNFVGITVPFFDETTIKLFVPLCYTEIPRCSLSKDCVLPLTHHSIRNRWQGALQPSNLIPRLNEVETYL